MVILRKGSVMTSFPFFFLDSILTYVTFLLLYNLCKGLAGFNIEVQRN